MNVEMVESGEVDMELGKGVGEKFRGVRRAFSFLGMQVASWWDLDETVALSGLHRRQPALLEIE